MIVRTIIYPVDDPDFMIVQSDHIEAYQLRRHKDRMRKRAKEALIEPKITFHIFLEDDDYEV